MRCSKNSTSAAVCRRCALAPGCSVGAGCPGRATFSAGADFGGRGDFSGGSAAFDGSGKRVTCRFRRAARVFQVAIPSGRTGSCSHQIENRLSAAGKSTIRLSSTQA